MRKSIVYYRWKKLSCFASTGANFNSILEGLPGAGTKPASGPCLTVTILPGACIIKPQHLLSQSYSTIHPGCLSSARGQGTDGLREWANEPFLGMCKEKTQMADLKCLRHAANTSLTAFPLFGFRVCARLLVRRKKTSPQHGLSLAKRPGAR